MDVGGLGLGLSTILYIWRIPLKKAIEKIANFGYEGLEIRAGEPDASSRKLSGGDRRKLRTLIQSRSLNLYSLTPDWADINLASPNPMMRQESIREVKEAIELAWDLGAQYFTLPLGRRYSIGAAPIKKAEDWALDSLENCLSFAEKSSVTICLEGYPGQLFGSAEGLLKVARKFHSKSLRIAGDASIAHATGDPSAFFKKIKEYIGLVHISDSEHLPPGLGRIEFREMFDTLKKIGYQGNYLLEIYYPKDPDWAAKHARAYVSKLVK